MTDKNTIEEKLEDLGRAIASDDSLVEKVMTRIQTKASAKPDSITKPKTNLLLRRFIMNRFTKLTTAAVIIIAVALSIAFFDKITAPAYAIEQTVEALKNVRFLHLIRRDEAGQIEDERWIEIGADGFQAMYRQDTPPNFFVVDNRENIFIYHKDKNTVLLSGPDGQRYTWISNLGQFFKDLAGESSVTIEENIDYWGTKAHRVRWLKLNQDFYIDPETKLPIAAGNYEITYEDPSEGTFDIPPVPEGVIFVDKRPGAKPTEEPQWMKNQDTAQQEFDEARHALAARHYSKAVELFTNVVEIQPLRNWAWFWLGKAHYKLGEYDGAIHEFSQVIDMFAKHKLVPYYCHLARGFAYQAKGMEDMARKDFKAALPLMIEALRHLDGAGMFDYADDPLHKGKNLSAAQRLSNMTNRLRIITGQNFGYDPNTAAEENEQVITAWEQWYENSGQIDFTPDAKLVPVPAEPEQEGK